jgi:hypothetical protein
MPGRVRAKARWQVVGLALAVAAVAAGCGSGLSENVVGSTSTAPACGPVSGLSRVASIDWSERPADVAPDAGGDLWSTFSLFAWSGGYLGFRHQNVTESAGSEDIAIEASRDGLSWSPVQTIAVVASAGEAMPVRIGQLLEGPAGLIAVGVRGTTRSDFPAVRSPTLLLESRDARSWRYSWTGDVFAGGGIAGLAASSTGYVALGYGGATNGQVVWSSADALSWTRQDWALAAGFFAPDATALGGSGVVGFGGGFVTATVRRTLVPSLVMPAAAWSANGRTWAASTIPGIRHGSAAIGGMNLTLGRLDSSTVLAQESAREPGSNEFWDMAWVSTDGRSWCGAPAAATFQPADLQSDGRHPLSVHFGADPAGPLAIASLGPDLTPTPVAQSGSVPTGNLQTALGPAGLVATDFDGTVFYLGALTGG